MFLSEIFTIRRFIGFMVLITIGNAYAQEELKNPPGDYSDNNPISENTSYPIPEDLSLTPTPSPKEVFIPPDPEEVNEARIEKEEKDYEELRALMRKYGADDSGIGPEKPKGDMSPHKMIKLYGKASVRGNFEELPSEKSVAGCFYAKGRRDPNVCYDETFDHIIYDPSKDSYDVYRELKRKHGIVD